MLLKHSDPTEISGIGDERRWNEAREGYRHRPKRDKPPMTPIELRNRRAFKESEAVKVGQRLGDIVVLPVDFPYTIHLPPF